MCNVFARVACGFKETGAFNGTPASSFTFRSCPYFVERSRSPAASAQVLAMYQGYSHIPTDWWGTGQAPPALLPSSSAECGSRLEQADFAPIGLPMPKVELPVSGIVKFVHNFEDIYQIYLVYIVSVSVAEKLALRCCLRPCLA